MEFHHACSIEIKYNSIIVTTSTRGQMCTRTHLSALRRFFDREHMYNRDRLRISLRPSCPHWAAVELFVKSVTCSFIRSEICKRAQ